MRFFFYFCLFTLLNEYSYSQVELGVSGGYSLVKFEQSIPTPIQFGYDPNNRKTYSVEYDNNHGLNLWLFSRFTHSKYMAFNAGIKYSHRSGNLREKYTSYVASIEEGPFGSILSKTESWHSEDQSSVFQMNGLYSFIDAELYKQLGKFRPHLNLGFYIGKLITSSANGNLTTTEIFKPSSISTTTTVTNLEWEDKLNNIEWGYNWSLGVNYVFKEKYLIGLLFGGTYGMSNLKEKNFGSICPGRRNSSDYNFNLSLSYSINKKLNR